MNIAFFLEVLGWALLVSATGYVLLTIVAQAAWARRRRRPPAAAGATQPVSVLKPLCGDEPRLYENLRSFCVQDYPQYQIVFGTRAADDPALAVARRLQAEFPQLDIAVISDARVHGRNLKISNVLNLLRGARHETIVIVDSDVSVDPQYLGRVVRPLQDPQVGLVTCLYRGRALGGAWTRLGRQFIDEWFAPAVLLARLFGSHEFGFGATLALRRQTLAALGGLQALLPHLADDHALGELVRSRGLRTVLSVEEVATDVTEQSLAQLAAHELRWLRTIRLVRPLSYPFLFVTFTLPCAAGGWLLSGAGLQATLLLQSALLGRLLLHLQSAGLRRGWRDLRGFCIDLCLSSTRDLFSLAVWTAGFLGQRVSWRGHELAMRATDSMPTLSNDSPEAYK